MPFVAALLLIAAPFIVIGFLIGYQNKLRRLPESLLFLMGGFLTIVGILGMASIGLIIYPVGVILVSIGMGRIARDLSRSTQRRG